MFFNVEHLGQINKYPSRFKRYIIDFRELGEMRGTPNFSKIQEISHI